MTIDGRSTGGADEVGPDTVPVVGPQIPQRNAGSSGHGGSVLSRNAAHLYPVLDVLTQDAIPYRRSQLGGAAVEALQGALDTGICAHGVSIQQTCLQCIRKLACAQGVQNLLPMKTIGQQVAEFRAAKEWSPKQMAEAVKKAGGDVGRQKIEQLEKVGNRIPKYIGYLAAAMGMSVDEILTEADLAPRRPINTPPPPSGPLTERLREELEADPYELIERGLRALVVVGKHKAEVLKLVRDHAETATEMQRAVEERLRQRDPKG
jgi:hypothetical protein